jgi:hypothetical protein
MAGPFGVPIRHSPLTIRLLFSCAIFLSERNDHDTFGYFRKEKIIGFSNRGSIADQQSPRGIRKPRRWEMG